MSEVTLTDRIKREAHEWGIRGTDALAKAHTTDPFNAWCRQGKTKKGKNWLLAEWPAGIFHEILKTRSGPFHVRRIHYWLVGQGNSLRYDGRPYRNENECWCELLAGVKMARYQGLIHWGYIEDRRNPEAINVETHYRDAGDLYDLEANLSLQPSFYEPLDAQAYQPYHLEVWCEKQTMNDVLVPLVERYGAVLVTGQGYQSTTRIWEAYRRISDIGKPARIFYISDYDLAGESMPRHVSRDLEFLCKTKKFADIHLFPIILTKQQVEHLDLPSEPRKRGQPGKKVELDALEALHPGYLAKIVSSHLDTYIDHDLTRQIEEINSEASRAMQEASKEILEPLRLKLSQFKDELEEARQKLSHKEKEILNAIDQPESSLEVETEDPYFDSRRDYWDQLEYYRA